MMVGNSLPATASAQLGAKGERGNSRGDAGLDDLLRDAVEPRAVRVVVALVDGEVKVVGAVDLDVEEAGAKNARGVSTIARTSSPRARGSARPGSRTAPAP